MAVDTADSNGECVRFYWDTDNNGQYNVDNETPFLTYNFGRLESSISVWCKDDDSLSSEKLHFWIYPDEPPDSITATSDPVTNGRKFSWSGMDKKDSLQTEYRILVHRSGDGGYNQPDSSNSADIAKNWTVGSAVEFNYTAGANKPFSWEYTPTDCQSGQTCTYYYQIEARDARGSITATQLSGTNNFDYTAP